MEEKNRYIPEGWKLKDIGGLIKENKKSTLKVSDAANYGNYPFFTSGEAILQHTDKQIDGENLFLATGGVANIKYHNGKASYSSDTYAITTNEEIESKYMYFDLLNILYYINSNYFQGSGLKHLQKKDFKKHEIIFPQENAEQIKIINILSKVDKAIQQTEKLIAKYTRIKTALMQDLLTKGVYQYQCLIESDLKGIKINSLFKQCNFKKITKVSQGFQISISKRKKYEGVNRFIYITVQYINNPERYAEYIENPPENVVCSEDDILFTRTGNTGQIVSGIKGVFHNNFFKVIFNDKEISREYLILYLNWKPVQDLIRELAGTTTIPDMNHGDFYEMPVFFPSTLAEQKKIADIINKSNEYIISYKDELLKLKSLKSGLMQDLLSGKVRVNHLIK